MSCVSLGTGVKAKQFFFNLRINIKFKIETKETESAPKKM